MKKELGPRQKGELQEIWKQASDSPTLERDFQYLQETGEMPAGYNAREQSIMEVADRFLRRKASISELRAAVRAAKGLATANDPALQPLFDRLGVRASMVEVTHRCDCGIRESCPQCEGTGFYKVSQRSA